MNLKRCVLFVAIILLLIQNAYADQIRPSGMLLDSSSMSPVKLPATGDIPDLLNQLEYYGHAVPYGFQQDLNGDGVKDFLTVSASRLCGTGGCLYALVDGKSMHQMGEFFGSPIVLLDQKINGYPVIQSYSHISAGSGNFATYVYDGKKYQVVSDVYLIGKSVEELFKSCDGHRRIAPMKDKKGK